MRRLAASVFLGAVMVLTGACEGPVLDAGPACDIGAEGCDCTVGGACDDGLSCEDETCVSTGDQDAGREMEDAGPTDAGDIDASVVSDAGPADAAGGDAGGVLDGGEDAGGFGDAGSDGGVGDAGTMDAGDVYILNDVCTGEPLGEVPPIAYEPCSAQNFTPPVDYDCGLWASFTECDPLDPAACHAGLACCLEEIDPETGDFCCGTDCSATAIADFDFYCIAAPEGAGLCTRDVPHPEWSWPRNLDVGGPMTFGPELTQNGYTNETLITDACSYPVNLDQNLHPYVVTHPARSRLTLRHDAFYNNEGLVTVIEGCPSCGEETCLAQTFTMGEQITIGDFGSLSFRDINLYNEQSNDRELSIFIQGDINSIADPISLEKLRVITMDEPLGPAAGDAIPEADSVCAGVTPLVGTSGMLDVMNLTNDIVSEDLWPDCGFNWLGETVGVEGLVSVTLGPKERISGHWMFNDHTAVSVMRPGCPLRTDSCAETFDYLGREPVGEWFEWVNLDDEPQEIWLLLEVADDYSNINSNHMLSWDIDLPDLGY